MEYRMINWNEIYIKPSDLDEVEALFQKHGWITLATSFVRHDEKMIEIQPRPEPYVAQENIAPLYEVARYIKGLNGSVIVSRNEEDWLHILYNGFGAYREVITPRFQFQIQEAKVISISAIQVACWKCGGLCKSTFVLPDTIIPVRDDIPFVLMQQDRFPVICLRCGEEQPLPKNAFVIA